MLFARCGAYKTAITYADDQKFYTENCILHRKLYFKLQDQKFIHTKQFNCIYCSQLSWKFMLKSNAIVKFHKFFVIVHLVANQLLQKIL
jgi:hypothetical protein